MCLFVSNGLVSAGVTHYLVIFASFNDFNQLVEISHLWTWTPPVMILFDWCPDARQSSSFGPTCVFDLLLWTLSNSNLAACFYKVTPCLILWWLSDTRNTIYQSWSVSATFLNPIFYYPTWLFHPWLAGGVLSLLNHWAWWHCPIYVNWHFDTSA